MNKTPNNSPGSEAVCREIKEHAEAIRKLLAGIYGDPPEKGSPHSHAYPEDVRAAARVAMHDFNRWYKVNMWFPALHEAMGLGELNTSGPCSHQDKDSQPGGVDGALEAQK